ncbi:MAG: DUF359 domain-containing protein [Candidatus Bathyarchaeota archaeon]|nr:DUF359 domain-containing protein [Candidatus Bathyarchaeota archaeon]
MINIRFLTPKLRRELKKPLGILLHGPMEEIAQILKAMVDEEKPTKIVSVGDKVSQDLASHSLMPDILIVDNRIMRREINPISVSAPVVVNVKNQAGTITDEAWRAVEQAAENSSRVKIVVDGEEDLLSLVAILTMPENSLVLYGQPPHKGIVVVKADSENKKKAESILERMKRV